MFAPPVLLSNSIDALTARYVLQQRMLLVVSPIITRAIKTDMGRVITSRGIGL